MYVLSEWMNEQMCANDTEDKVPSPVQGGMRWGWEGEVVVRDDTNVLKNLEVL